MLLKMARLSPLMRLHCQHLATLWLSDTERQECDIPGIYERQYRQLELALATLNDTDNLRLPQTLPEHLDLLYVADYLCCEQSTMDKLCLAIVLSPQWDSRVIDVIQSPCSD